MPAAPAGDAAAPLRESLQVDLGGMLQAHFVREASGGEMARVVRGAIRIGEARERFAEPTPTDVLDLPALPASGVAANVALRRARRRRLASRARPAAERSGPAGLEPCRRRRWSSIPVAAPATFPTRSRCASASSRSAPRRLDNLTAGMSQRASSGAPTSARSSSTATSNTGRRDAAAAARAACSRGCPALSLPKGEAEKVENLLDEPLTSVPALDIVVDDFELRGKRLGRLEIEATSRGSGARDAGREWQLAKLNLSMPEAQLVATGTWGGVAQGAASPRRAAMNFTLALSDSGALLERLGMGRTVRGGKGSLTGEVSWPGSPLSPDYEKMTGKVTVAIDSGQFLKAGPGAARLLGVLSLQSLPRRLLFDFRDLFAEGFAFDNVIGDVRIGDGKAATHNLRMRGAAAVVLMEGSADLEHETQDLRVVVVPEIDAGTASLGLCGDQSGDRPGHVPGPVPPEEAARRGKHARVPRHRAVGRSEGRAGRAQPARRGFGRARPRRRPARTHDHALRAAMKIAAVQMVSTPSVATNLDAAAPPGRRRCGRRCGLVVLPEYFCLLGQTDRDKLERRRDARRRSDPAHARRDGARASPLADRRHAAAEGRAGIGRATAMPPIAS